MIWDTPSGYLNAAANSGEFATQQAVNAEQLRAQAFANEQARGAAQFALGGLGQAFQQRQQLNDDAFRRQQAEQANQFRQQDFDAQDAYRNDSLNAGLQRAQIGADAGIDRTALQNEGRLDVAGVNAQARLGGIQLTGDMSRDLELLRQGAIDNRFQQGDETKRYLGDQAELGRNTRFDAGQEGMTTRQNTRLDAAAGENDLDRQLKLQVEQDQHDFQSYQEELKRRFTEDRDATKFQNDWAKLQDWKSSRDAQAQQAADQKSIAMRADALKQELNNYQQLVTAYTNARNRPMALAAQQAYDRTFYELNTLTNRAPVPRQAPPLASVLPPMPGPPPNVPQVYQQPQMQPAPQGATPPQQPAGGNPAANMVDVAAVQQVVAMVKAQMPGASREQIKAAVYQQLVAAGIDPAAIQ